MVDIRRQVISLGQHPEHEKLEPPPHVIVYYIIIIIIRIIVDFIELLLIFNYFAIIIIIVVYQRVEMYCFLVYKLRCLTILNHNIIFLYPPRKRMTELYILYIIRNLS